MTRSSRVTDHEEQRCRLTAYTATPSSTERGHCFGNNALGSLTAQSSLSWFTLLSTLLCTLLLLIATYYQSIRIAELGRNVAQLQLVTRSIQLSETYVKPRERRSLALTDERAERSAYKMNWRRISRKRKKKAHNRRRSYSSSGDAGADSYLRFLASSSSSPPPCTCQGLPGPKGDRGEKGSKGSRPMLPSFITELTGPPGPKGDTGVPGPRGDQGPKGDNGKDCCDIGMVMRSNPNLLVQLQGPPGDKGDKGDTGMAGRQGLGGTSIDRRTMEDIAMRVRFQVMQNINSSICIPGPAGPRGMKGEKGVSGFDGRQGQKGEKGGKGPRGRRGFKGDQGAPGLDAPCPIGPDGLPLPSCYSYYPPFGSKPAGSNNGGYLAPPPMPSSSNKYKTAIIHTQPAVVYAKPPSPEPPAGPPAVLRLP